MFYDAAMLSETEALACKNPITFLGIYKDKTSESNYYN